eukprot:3649586-Prymnesium_polylepis.1
MSAEATIALYAGVKASLKGWYSSAVSSVRRMGARVRAKRPGANTTDQSTLPRSLWTFAVELQCWGASGYVLESGA